MSADDVINWSEAMDQCGDDEEFLTELLSDLRGEVDAQMVKIDDALKTINDQSFLLIMRASHVIKGASSNLMCEQLRKSSLHLEQAASSANDIDSQNTQALEIATATVREKFAELQIAVEKYHKYLNDAGI